jgi:hypothetical protein
MIGMRPLPWHGRLAHVFPGAARRSHGTWCSAAIACALAVVWTSSLAVTPGIDPATQPVAARSPFTFVDVFIDPQGKPLAAYQFELRTTAGDARLVGIEGGEHAAFAHPPYPDPKALLNDRIVIAAFNTAPADRLPSGKTRVARLMVRAGAGNERPTYDVKLQVAASAEGKPLEAVISISEGAAP